MNIIENPSAFPWANDADKQYNWINRGMTLRDYFAASFVSSGHVFQYISTGHTPALAAQQAYMMADAMLKAREA